jgi:hypothetical protein
MNATKLIAILAAAGGCAYLTKVGMGTPVTAQQQVPRPTPGNVEGVQVTFGTLEGLVRQLHGDVVYRPSVQGRQLRAWLTDYDASKICFGIEDYPAGNSSITGTVNPFERLDMSLVRSDGTKLTEATRDRFADDVIDLYFRNDNGMYDVDADAQYYYATARACFPTKELFIKADTTSLTWNVGDSHYTFKFEPTTAAECVPRRGVPCG